ncbi:hypothetical protein [Pseudomonas sp. NFXW11]|uniref:hypothetical protein n=1 Tax=Pseudomonas sp. NFXW11 TaxID=2819531 RepID=UPI003CEA8A15
MLALWGAMVSADTLPHRSILQRYGVTPEQLPAWPPASEQKQAPEPEPYRFSFDAEDSQAPVGPGNSATPHLFSELDDIRQLKECQRIRAELQRRGKSQSIYCQPGQGPFPWSH